MPFNPFHNGVCHPLSNVSPLDPAVDLKYCTPVAPTSDARFAGKVAVTPTKPLPWDGCYHDGSLNMTLRLRTKLQNHTMATKLPFAEARRHERLVEEYNQQRWARNEAEQAQNGSTSHEVSARRPSIVGRPGGGSSESSQAGDAGRLEDGGFRHRTSHEGDGDDDHCSRSSNCTSYFTDDGLEEVFSIVEAMLTPETSDRMLPIVDVEYDLSAVGELHDPRLFIDELREVLKCAFRSREPCTQLLIASNRIATKYDVAPKASPGEYILKALKTIPSCIGRLCAPLRRLRLPRWVRGGVQ